jgi:hypothetical protein
VRNPSPDTSPPPSGSPRAAYCAGRWRGGYLSGKQRKRRLREWPAEPITAQVLRELFLATKVVGEWKMPRDGELEKLADILERWRGVFQMDQYLRRRRKFQDKTLIAFKTASVEIAKLDEAELKAAADDHAPEHALRYLRDRLAESNDLRANIERIAWHPALTYSSRARCDGLEMVGRCAAQGLQTMKPANPTFDPGIGRTGPVARFVSAVVPLITGERPKSLNSIATQLITRRTSKNSIR